jgi:hypothetical protein
LYAHPVYPGEGDRHPTKGPYHAAIDRFAGLERPTVFAVNIGKLGWTREHWKAIDGAYPYNLGFANHDNPKLREIDDRLRKLYGNREFNNTIAVRYSLTAK